MVPLKARVTYIRGHPRTSLHPTPLRCRDPVTAASSFVDTNKPTYGSRGRIVPGGSKTSASVPRTDQADRDPRGRRSTASPNPRSAVTLDFLLRSEQFCYAPPSKFELPHWLFPELLQCPVAHEIPGLVGALAAGTLSYHIPRVVIPGSYLHRVNEGSVVDVRCLCSSARARMCTRVDLFHCVACHSLCHGEVLCSVVGLHPVYAC